MKFESKGYDVHCLTNPGSMTRMTPTQPLTGLERHREDSELLFYCAVRTLNDGGSPLQRNPYLCDLGWVFTTGTVG